MEMTNLRLVMRRGPAGVSLLDFHVTNGLATIGRGNGSDWVLPDPQRLLSKRHCEIAFRNGCWKVTDLSSNGTTVSGRTLPPGVPVDLQDGSRIGIGSFEIDVRMSEAGSVADTEKSNPFDKDATMDIPRPKGVSVSHDNTDYRSRQSIFDVVSEPGYGSGAVETVSIIHPFDIALGSESAPLGELFDAKAAPSISNARSETTQSVPTDLHDVFQPPRKTADLLPEDWDSPVPEVEKTVPQPFPEMVKVPEARSSSPVSEKKSAPSDQMGFGPNAPQRDETGPPVDAGVTDDSAVAAFMRGAALSGTPTAVPEQFFEDLGQAFRAMVVGLRRAMIARTEIKREFRIDRTMIQPFGNNPLKFAVDDDDALAALVGMGRRTGFRAVDAVVEALRDIQVHEMAVTRAIEPAMREYLEANGPKAVLSRLSLPPEQALSLFRRARAWTAYVALHEEMIANTSETMDGTFGRAFGQAYEAAREEIDGQLQASGSREKMR